ncbi:hypothetical protein Y032_0064g3490 [Ancylostoma ceylanicum]|nr:hypothetical protein Y032_0064g3490 [Ancylostoma ceylanicum]
MDAGYEECFQKKKCTHRDHEGGLTVPLLPDFTREGYQGETRIGMPAAIPGKMTTCPNGCMLCSFLFVGLKQISNVLELLKMNAGRSRRTPQLWSRERVLFTALAARLTLVFYSNIHDYIFEVNFTDIDYSVYSDAARHVAEGRSPFERETYRYTPALAWLLLPVVTYKDFGKFLFCIFDILVGWMFFEIISPQGGHADEERRQNKDTQSSTGSADFHKTDDADSVMASVVIFWLANPLTAIISARFGFFF